jgi:hypothetical protein
MYGASYVLVTNLTPIEEQHRADDSFFVFSQSEKDVPTIIHWIYIYMYDKLNFLIFLFNLI